MPRRVRTRRSDQVVDPRTRRSARESVRLGYESPRGPSRARVRSVRAVRWSRHPARDWVRLSRRVGGWVRWPVGLGSSGPRAVPGSFGAGRLSVPDVSRRGSELVYDGVPGRTGRRSRARVMEQIYYTQCPVGYGLGASNGFQVKRLSRGLSDLGRLPPPGAPGLPGRGPDAGPARPPLSAGRRGRRGRLADPPGPRVRDRARASGAGPAATSPTGSGSTRRSWARSADGPPASSTARSGGGPTASRAGAGRPTTVELSAAAPAPAADLRRGRPARRRGRPRDAWPGS